jgi:hypothetical protein
MLSTNPAPTGSGTCSKTTGMPRVARRPIVRIDRPMVGSPREGSSLSGFAVIPYSAHLTGLLRSRLELPCRCRQPGNDLPPPHSITSSAATKRGCGTLRPSALAVVRLMISSNLIGACTGRSPGLWRPLVYHRRHVPSRVSSFRDEPTSPATPPASRCTARVPPREHAAQTQLQAERRAQI